MKNIIYFLVMLILLQVVIKAQQTQRFVAVTIDDLPVVSLKEDLKTRQEITKNLLRHIVDAQVSVIGFVNEFKLYIDDKRDSAQIDLLRQWLNADIELGNHTFSHLSLNSNSLEKYENEILRGEIITKELMQAKGKQIRYFRHPYLMTGRTMKIKQNLADFLTLHGYKIAPITFDTDDYIFARVYDLAAERDNQNLRERVGSAYIPYLESKFDYGERQSVKLFGRKIKQTLLLHANSINARYFGDVVEMLKKRGYKFVTLEDALTDEAYKLPDTYTGKWGISWLARWALAKGKKNILSDETNIPDFIVNEYEKYQAAAKDKP